MKKTIIILTLFSGLILNKAQIFDRIKNAAKNSAEQKAENKSGDIVDKGLGKLEEGIGNIFKKKDKKSPAGNTNTSTKNNSESKDETDFSSYKNSTFVSGKDVLFFEDFSVSRLGSGQGNWFVNNWDAENPAQISSLNNFPGKWLKIPRYGYFYPSTFKSLPENCTIEFDMFMDEETVSEMQSGLRFSFLAKNDRENYDLHFNNLPEVVIDIHPSGKNGAINIWGGRENGLDESKINFLNENFKSGWFPKEINHVAISRNGFGIKVFINGKELVNVNNAFLKKANYNFMMSSNQWGNGIYITNIRVGSNTANAMNDIQSTGKFVTNAIYFNTGSSQIKPESWATLKQSAEAVKAANSNFIIIGHTDSDGDANSNLSLSQKRAEAVKKALVNEFGITESKLTTQGKGENQLLNSDKTDSEKAMNRRVEFIKQ